MNDVQILIVEGMNCGHCKKAVEDALNQVTGVKKVQVQLEQGLATVFGDADIQKLIFAIEEEGYKAAPSMEKNMDA